MGHTRDFTLKSGAVIHTVLSDGWDHSHELPVLCLSGFGCSHYNFEEIEKELGRDYPMVLVDNKGMGQSSPAKEEYSLKEVAMEALEVMDQLKVEKFHLMGISMGGFLSQLIALEAPERLASLTLMCTTSGGDEFISLPPMPEEQLKAFYALEEPKRTELAVAATVYPTLPQENPELFQKICHIRRSHPVDVEQVLLQKKAVDKWLSKPWPIENIKTPTLILSGANDRFVNPKNAQKLQSKISGSQLALIPESDHLFFLEKPAAVASHLREFLKGAIL